ncbi:MAG: DNA-processing protein DprA [Candidatus Eremiobacteraeota bacterium]|nr:DNA-processing protein DprA [Candidatus Eremiobacteraeota bacterium]
MTGDIELGYLLAVSAAAVCTPRPLAMWFDALGGARPIIEYARRHSALPPPGCEALGKAALGRICTIDDRAASDALSAMADCGAFALTRQCERYPSRLRQLSDAPLALYCRGDAAALAGRTIAIVGSRAATQYGRSVTATLCRDFHVFDVTIVSGLARGIDAAAHRGAIDGGLRTVAVIGSGLGALYPAYHSLLADDIVAGGGAVLSEFPPALAAQAHQFPMRNRIVAALADATVIVEAGAKSGALITARLADEIGRPVFAIPGDVGRLTSQGTNALIADGVPLATCAAEIAQSLRWDERARVDPSGGAEDGAHGVASAADPLVAQLQAGGSTIDELSCATGLDPATLAARLTMLELGGMVERQGGLFSAVNRGPSKKTARDAHQLNRRR